MRIQMAMLAGLIFALVIAVFAVINVNAVAVDYLFGSSDIPLILVILGSALLGGATVGLFGIIRQYKQHKRIKTLERRIQLFEDQSSASLLAQLSDNQVDEPDGSTVRSDEQSSIR